MATCPVCGGELPAQRGPRARRYCSRACQAKAYRARQHQRDQHRTAADDEHRLLREYDGVPALQLADQLSLAAGRLAGALTAGLPADDFDLGVLARIPVVLAARAHQAAPAAHAAHGIPDRQATLTMHVLDLEARPPAARSDQPDANARVVQAAAGDSGTGAQLSRDETKRGTAAARSAARPARASRDDSAARPKGIEPRPQKLAKKKAAAIVDAAQLMRDQNYSDTHRWVLRSGDTVIGYVEPSYGGASRSGRNGWISRMNGALGPRCRSRDGAAADLAARWVRVVTAEPRRTLTGD